MHNPSCSHPAERSAGTHWAEKTWMQPWHSASQPSPPKCWAVTVLGVEGHTSGTQWYRMALRQSCEFEKRAKERNLDSVVIITTMPAGFSNPICEGFWAVKWSKPLQSYRNQWVEWAPITLWIQMNVLPHRVNAEWHRDLLPHKGRTDGWCRQSHSPEGGWSYWGAERAVPSMEVFVLSPQVSKHLLTLLHANTIFLSPSCSNYLPMPHLPLLTQRFPAVPFWDNSVSSVGLRSHLCAYTGLLQVRGYSLTPCWLIPDSMSNELEKYTALQTCRKLKKQLNNHKKAFWTKTA